MGEAPLLSSPLVRGVRGFRGLAVHWEYLSNSKIYHKYKNREAEFLTKTRLLRLVLPK